MISAKDVKKLRDMTGAGMMDSKKALQEANGDFDAAVDILRKKGQKVSAKRADREATEGVIATALSTEAQVGAIVEVNCETDFVARNEEFVTFANQVAELVLAERPADRDALMALTLGERTVQDALTDMIGKIGEKIDIRRFAIIESETGSVVEYIHPGAKLGVLVEVRGNGQVVEAGRDVAMQAAAMNPVAATRDDVPEETKQKEMDIAREVARNENKPDHIIDRIAQGKLERFYKDNVLLEQPFVKDSSVTVKKMLENAGAEFVSYVRFALGG